PAWVARGRAAGHPARDPIFVLGLPRAGSTLVEQILASHSHVEGTSELPDIAQIARAIAGYPQGLAALDDPALHALGAQYLART
ncbi:sulfotransferase, partial [Acinetobacter baumannii]